MSDIKHGGRHIGLWGATGIGVGAIVGGGILALAGVAYAATGPSAVIAFGLNGIIAFLTALSFAEVSARFPLSGGTYVFAKKVLSLDAAFIVGWIVWFASIVASALYAVGFASFARLGVEGIIRAGLGKEISISQPVVVAVAVGAIMVYAAILLLKSAGSGQWINVAKVIVFGVIIAGGCIFAFQQPTAKLSGSLRPFFPFGGWGLVQAMGFSFIALQGFDLISAVAGEVRDPERVLPRAMFLSLGIALAIYLPLLLLVATVGTPSGVSLAEVCEETPTALVAVAARNFLGPFGYWLVVCAGVLSMLSALHANVMAASQMARAMARDRSLPHGLSRLSKTYRTPVAAIVLTTGIIITVVLCVPDIEDAGAAASLVFLLSFALVHGICILLRRRSAPGTLPFRTPFYPAVPVAGGLLCISLAVFQGVAVRSAGLVAGVWMVIGMALYLAVFARRARVVDALVAAIDPETTRLRGRSPLVLVPIANPRNARGLVSLANALAPEIAGRVLLLSVINPQREQDGENDRESLLTVQEVVKEALSVAIASGKSPETLLTLAPKPWVEIVRVARNHQCESLLLGLTAIGDETRRNPLDNFLGKVDSDVVLLRAEPEWHPDRVQKILIPLGGKGVHGRLLARLLGSLFRDKQREVTFLRVVPTAFSKTKVNSIKRKMQTTAKDLCPENATIQIIQSDNALDAIVEECDKYDLTVLGVQRIRKNQKIMGNFTTKVAGQTSVPLIVISSRG